MDLDLDMELAIFGDESRKSVEVPAGDPVAELFEKFDHEAFLEKRADPGWLDPLGGAEKQKAETVHKSIERIPSEPRGVPASHADGTFTEEDGEATWTLEYRGGKLVRQTVMHPDGSEQVFDEDAVEVSVTAL